MAHLKKKKKKKKIWKNCDVDEMGTNSDRKNVNQHKYARVLRLLLFYWSKNNMEPLLNEIANNAA